MDEHQTDKVFHALFALGGGLGRGLGGSGLGGRLLGVLLELLAAGLGDLLLDLPESGALSLHGRDVALEALVAALGEDHGDELLAGLRGGSGAGLLLGELPGAADDNGGLNEALDLGGLGVRALVGEVLGGAVDLVELAAHNVLRDGLAREAEELADVVGALGAEAAGNDNVGEALDGVRAALSDDDGDGGEVVAEDATTDGAALALTRAGAPGGVAGAAGLHEEHDASGGHDALLHGEAVLILTARDAEAVAVEGLGEDLTVDLLTHAVVSEVGLAEDVVVEVDRLRGARGGRGNDELHVCLKFQ
eukprot:PhM_4_TR7615/c0_g1_i1/m.1993